MAQQTIGQVLVGSTSVFGGTQGYVTQSELDFWYDYAEGSYNANYSSSNLAPSIGAYLDFEMSLSGSGTNPTYSSALGAWEFPVQSEASIVGKSFEWLWPGSGTQPLETDAYSIFMVFKANNFPAYNVDHNTILEFQLDAPGTIFDVQLGYQAGRSNRPVVTLNLGGYGYTAAWDATGYGVDFSGWSIVQIDYSSVGNPSGNAQCYINNKFIGDSFLAVGLSTYKETINVAQSFGGYLAAVGGYDKVLTDLERDRLHRYYMMRYSIPGF